MLLLLPVNMVTFDQTMHCKHKYRVHTHSQRQHVFFFLLHRSGAFVIDRMLFTLLSHISQEQNDAHICHKSKTEKKPKWNRKPAAEGNER